MTSCSKNKYIFVNEKHSHQITILVRLLVMEGILIILLSAGKQNHDIFECN